VHVGLHRRLEVPYDERDLEGLGEHGVAHRSIVCREHGGEA
jgi:hypothetical protein